MSPRPSPHPPPSVALSLHLAAVHGVHCAHQQASEQEACPIRSAQVPGSHMLFMHLCLLGRSMWPSKRYPPEQSTASQWKVSREVCNYYKLQAALVTFISTMLSRSV